MIEYDNDLEEMTAICDAGSCSNEETVQGSWQDCIDQLKQLGWKIKKVGEEWLHFCPDDAGDN